MRHCYRSILQAAILRPPTVMMSKRSEVLSPPRKGSCRCSFTFSFFVIDFLSIRFSSVSLLSVSVFLSTYSFGMSLIFLYFSHSFNPSLLPFVSFYSHSSVHLFSFSLFLFPCVMLKTQCSLASWAQCSLIASPSVSPLAASRSGQIAPLRRECSALPPRPLLPARSTRPAVRRNRITLRLPTVVRVNTIRPPTPAPPPLRP